MLSLRSGANAVVVAPEHGAAVVGWRLDGLPILRRALPEAAVGGDPHAMGWFPLIPYCNRIGLGRFARAGQTYVLERNFGDSAHTIHGIGWRRAWAVDSVTADSVTLRLRHRPDATWPFAFDAVIAYRVSGSAVMVTMAVTNRHDSSAPVGMGLHPFFPKRHDPLLRFAAGGVWDNGPDALPLRHMAVPAAWDHATQRPVASSRLDNCFTGWDGVAAFAAGPVRVRVEASAVFGNVQVFTPGWADFFCVEPVTHVPDAVNGVGLPAGQGMDELGPGAVLRGAVCISVAVG